MTVRRIIKDLQDFHDDPPPGIFIETDEDCIMNHIVLIVGPEGTPYEGGFFLFELVFPPDYPFKPPKVEIRTSDPRGSMRFNPNLYINGKVCLSILGTWAGPKWSPIQTLATCLLSIRSLLNEMPLENEPGFEKVAKKQKLGYNEAVTQLVLKEAVIRQLNDGLPRTVILKNTGLKFSIFLPTMKKWFNEHYPGYVAKTKAMKREKIQIRLGSHLHHPDPDRILQSLSDLGIKLGAIPAPSPASSTASSTASSAASSTASSAASSTASSSASSTAPKIRHTQSDKEKTQSRPRLRPLPSQRK